MAEKKKGKQVIFELKEVPSKTGTLEVLEGWFTFGDFRNKINVTLKPYISKEGKTLMYGTIYGNKKKK